MQTEVNLRDNEPISRSYTSNVAVHRFYVVVLPQRSADQ